MTPEHVADRVPPIFIDCEIELVESAATQAMPLILHVEPTISEVTDMLCPKAAVFATDRSLPILAV